jgi:ubiquinone/menaquinone biosynthesis C-methylase UbiE
MFICPDCSTELNSELQCVTCSWKAKKNGVITSFISSSDAKDTTIQSYCDNYDLISEEDLHSSIVSKRYLQNQAKILANFVKINEDSEICDIGVGQGYLLKNLLKKNPKTATAVDIAKAYLLNFSDVPNLNLIHANAENLPFKNKFDVITSTDVIEHVLNVGSFLYCINRAMKINGLFYVRVPFRETLMSYSPFLGCKYKFVHLRSFNYELLNDYLKASGFKLQNVKYDGFWIDHPRPFWKKTKKLSDYYQNLMIKFTKKMDYIEDINLWPNWFSKLMMKPFEIVVEAKKIRNL